MCAHEHTYAYICYMVHVCMHEFMCSLKRCPITLLNFETLLYQAIVHISALILF